MHVQIMHHLSCNTYLWSHNIKIEIHTHTSQTNKIPCKRTHTHTHMHLLMHSKSCQTFKFPTSNQSQLLEMSIYIYICIYRQICWKSPLMSLPSHVCSKWPFSFLNISFYKRYTCLFPTLSGTVGLRFNIIKNKQKTRLNQELFMN